MVTAEQLKDNKSILVVLPSEDIQKNVDTAISSLVKKEKSAVAYISLNKPYKTVVQSWKKKKIDMDKILFIDCITSTVEEPKEEKNVIYVPSPSGLTAISLAVNTFFKKMAGKKTVMIDALSTLLIYNEINTVARFTNDIVEKSRVAGGKAVIFTTKHDELINKVSLFFDEILKK